MPRKRVEFTLTAEQKRLVETHDAWACRLAIEFMQTPLGQIARRNNTAEDICQEARYWMCHAASRYKKEIAEFTTYSSYVVTNRLCRFAFYSCLVRVPAQASGRVATFPADLQRAMGCVGFAVDETDNQDSINNVPSRPEDPDAPMLIEDIFSLLDEEHAAIVRGFFFEGKALHEIETPQGLSHESVRMRLQAAIREIQERLDIPVTTLKLNGPYRARPTQGSAPSRASRQKSRQRKEALCQ
jgi:RNA polymerase sigma factor (sigma-70 family)